MLLGAYDFDMIKIILRKCGFINVTKKILSKIPDFKIPCHILGRSSKYHNLNNKFYKKTN